MDTSLIKKVINGNDHAFRFLVEKYQVHIYKTVYAILQHQRDAEDAAQEVFIKIYTSLSTYKHEGFKTWITRIAVNHAIDVKRQKIRRQEETSAELEFKHAEALQTESTEERLLNQEEQQLIQKRISELPESYRTVIYGFYIKEKTYQQLAEEEQIQVKTIETRLYRARQWMKKHWKEEDFL